MRSETLRVRGGKTLALGIFVILGLGVILLKAGLANEQAQIPVVRGKDVQGGKTGVPGDQVGRGDLGPGVKRIKVVQGGDSAVPGEQVSRWVVGPGVNEPDPFPGWGGPIGKGGTVGWGGVGRSKKGTLIVAFSAGYWHENIPTGNPLSAPEIQRVMAEWSGYPRYLDKIGAGHTSPLPSPTGGRIMFVRSEDGGRTWSKPQTLADTAADDRQAGLLALPDGTWICSWFTIMGQSPDPWGKDKEIANQTHTFVARSFDDGKTWTKPARVQTQDFWPTQAEGADGPPVLLKDGSILLASYGVLHNPGNCRYHFGRPRGCLVLPIWKSQDEGKTWKLLSADGIIDNGIEEPEEPHLAELPDGRLVMVSRQFGNITWSSDKGKTWTKPDPFMNMMAANLTMLKDGTLLCVFGDGSVRAIFSTDGGNTWIAPDAKHGFMIARGVWGYAADVLLPDGTVYIAYQTSAIRTPEEIKNSGMKAVRLRVRADHSGIDLLPPDPDAVLGKNVAVAAK